MNECGYFKEDYVFINGKKRMVCSYYDIDNPGLCKHPNRNTCILYIHKNITTDKKFERIIEEFGLTLVKK